MRRKKQGLAMFLAACMIITVFGATEGLTGRAQIV